MRQVARGERRLQSADVADRTPRPQRAACTGCPRSRQAQENPHFQSKLLV